MAGCLNVIELGRVKGRTGKPFRVRNGVRSFWSLEALGSGWGAWYLVEELDHSTLKFQHRVGHLDDWKLNLITLSYETRDLDLIL